MIILVNASLISASLIANAQITGKAKSCVGELDRYKSIKASYSLWEVKGGTIIKNYNDSIDVQWRDANINKVTYKYLNPGKGTLDSFVLNVSVFQKTKPFIEGKSIACANGINKYSYSFPKSDFKPLWKVINGTMISQPNDKILQVEWNYLGIGKVILSNTNADLCYLPDTMLINVVTPPNLKIWGRTQICKKEFELYSVEYAVNDTYEWSCEKGHIFGSNQREEVGVHWDEPCTDILSLKVFNKLTECTQIYRLPIVINDVPNTKLKPFPDICVAGEMLKLTGGTPEGGVYGGGYYVRDGYFNIAFAGVGKHLITYSYSSKNGLCTGSDTAYINVLPVPKKPFIYYENNILYTNLNMGIQWYLNGIAIQGANQKTLVPTLPGYYSLRGKNSQGCISEKSDSILIDNSSVDDFDNTQEKLYSIISDGSYIDISCKFNISKIKIYNILGECQYEDEPNSPFIKIDSRKISDQMNFQQMNIPQMNIIHIVCDNGSTIIFKYIGQNATRSK